MPTQLLMSPEKRKGACGLRAGQAMMRERKVEQSDRFSPDHLNASGKKHFQTTAVTKLLRTNIPTMARVQQGQGQQRK